ncbi:hypothetical protein [Litorisediminicola beolgyonensis]|uniref:Seryl-tRNA synthetase n=1 Tax=Litorisediminicola beolgyonensis TaxID=1173614 RepID=A0ABW3ZHF8_9RHOB
MRPTLLAWALLAAAIGFAASPLLAPGFNGFEPDQFPIPQDNPPVQPAGYAFAIWGLIYLWLIAGSAFGALRRASSADWTPMRAPLLASLGPGILWLPLAQVSVLGATLLIWWMLVMALAALIRTGTEDRWWQVTPVALYAGWLTAASSVSIGLVLAGYGLLGGTWAALVSLAIALAIALAVQARMQKAPEYGLAVIWALVGVIVANTGPLNWPVAGLAGFGIVAILALRSQEAD